MKILVNKSELNQVVVFILTIVRIAIGWHFLYEGIQN